MTPIGRSPDAVPAGRSALRRVLRVLAWAGLALVAAAVVGWFVLVRPRAASIAFLRRLSAPPDAGAVAALGGRMVAARGGRPACLVLAGTEAAAPVVVAVAGLTREGVADARVGRLVVALHDAGFAVVAPELAGLRAPGDDDRLVDPVVATWSATLAGELGLPPTRSVALLGVSLGAGLVVRAVARSDPSDPPPGSVSALLLVGPPDDSTALAREWFRRPFAAPNAGPAEKARAEAGAFARHGILRAALPSHVPLAEHGALRRWIDGVGDASAAEAPAPADVASAPALRWIAIARAEDHAADDDVAWLLAGAKGFLEAASPAAVEGASLARVAAPTYLVHGVADPLVPVGESRRLAARLTGARVAVLESRVIAHVDVSSPGIVETWRHVTFLQSFFDDAGAAR